MWLSKRAFEELIKAQTETRVLSEQNHVLRTNLDHARLRLNQLEKERAQLMYAATGTKIVAPEFISTGNDTSMPMWGGGPLNLADLPAIEDIGDEMAEKLGISWDKEGRVSYADLKDGE